ncbi:MAG: hypothetical protein RL398_1204 [Planctomycetota bacterium]
MPHAAWLVAAGLALGSLAALCKPATAVRVAMILTAGAAVAVMSALTLQNWSSGFWPIHEPDRIAHYGSTAQAMLRGGILLTALLGASSLAGALSVAWLRRLLRPSNRVCNPAGCRHG